MMRRDSDRSSKRHGTSAPRWIARALAVAAVTCASVSITPMVAVAQPADPVTEVARQRYKDGVKAYDAGNYEEARNAFMQAYQLKHLPVVLLNLGQSELKSNHVADGGNHLMQFLREYKEAKPDEINSAKAGIEEAKRKVGQVAISVNQPGADLTIDSVDLGKSPLSEPIFADPGARTITATLNGATASTKVDVKKGETVAAAIAFAGVAPPPVGPGPGPNPVGPGPGPGPGPNPVGPGPGPGPGPNVGPQPYPPQPIGPVGPGPTGPQTAEPHRQDFGKWYAHRPLAWVGTGLAAVGLGLGIGFSAAASSAASTTNDVADTIRAHADEDGVKAPCSEDGTADHAGYEKACTSLRDSISTHDTDVAVAAVGWVTFGVAAIGTVTYIMVDWYPKKTTDVGVTIVPIITPGYAGVAGQF